MEDSPHTIVMVWDRDDAQEVERIKKEFEEYLQKGWIAFAVTSDKQKIHVYKFDSNFEKIILTPIIEGG